MPLTGEHHGYRAILPRVWIKGKASCHRPRPAGALSHRDRARPGRRASIKIFLRIM